MASVEHLFDPTPYSRGYPFWPEAEQLLEERLDSLRAEVVAAACREARDERAGVVTSAHVDVASIRVLRPIQSADLLSALGGLLAGGGISAAWIVVDGGQHSTELVVGAFAMLSVGGSLIAYTFGRRRRGELRRERNR